MKQFLQVNLKVFAVIWMAVVTIINPLLAVTNSSFERMEEQLDLESTKISFKVVDAPIIEVLRKIEEGTEFHMAYVANELPSDTNITQHVKNSSLLKVLESLSRDYNLKFTQVNNTIHVSQKPRPSEALSVKEEVLQRPVSGRILDEFGEPLPGVNVLVKGTNQVAISDLDGQFGFENVADNAVLIFSFIGFKTEEVSILGKDTIEVTLTEDLSELQEVVVVGFGAQKKANLTGAVSTVDAKTIENRPVTNVMNALQGTAPGLIVTRSSGQPGKENYNLNIRGITSVNGKNTPLVIVDGVEGDLDLLNPNDIESISVLKDAAAASIFGAKAADGVILVTTKKGVAGKTQVTYTGMFTVNKPYSQPDLLSSYEQGIMQNEARVNKGGNPVWREDQLAWMQDDNVNYQINENNPNRYNYYYNLNKIDLVMRDLTYSQNHNLAIKGGNENTQYLISLGYYDQNGVFKLGPDGTDRYNARVNLNTKFSKVFSLDSRISYSLDKTSSPATRVDGDYGLIYQIYQSRSIYPIFLPETNDTKYGQGTVAYYATLKDGGYNQRNRGDFNGIFTLNANVAKGLTMKLVYNPRFRNYKEEEFRRTVPFYDLAGPSNYLNQVNSINKNRTTIFNNNVQLYADYDLTVRENHKFHVLGGTQFQTYRLDSISATARALMSNDAPSLNFGSDPNVPPTVLDKIDATAYLSYFGRLNYSYKDKYLFEANLRNDISSKLAPGFRSKIFPSFSVGWNVTAEQWFTDALPFFTQLKFRGSWGKLGNANVLGSYDYISLLNQGSSYYFNNVSNISLYQKNMASPEKSWETIKSTNIGIDFGFLDYRLTGSFDYFVRLNEDMLVKVILPTTLGLDPAQSNSAKLETKGWELVLGWRDQVGNFNYNVGFNLSDNQNKVLEYAGQSVYKEGLNKIVEGLPVNSIYGYQADGYFQSDSEAENWAFQDNRTAAGDIKYIDQNGDGKINGGQFRPDDHGDLINLGNTSPRLLYGFNLNMEYKGFDLAVFFQGVAERKMLIFTNAAIPIMQSWRMPWKLQQDYWTEDNRDAKFPRLYEGASHNAKTSSHWVQDAAYLRLKNLQVGYTFKGDLLKKAGIANARLYFSGQDLWEVSKMWFTYYDPENPNNVSYNYPFFRSYAIGLNVTF